MILIILTIHFYRKRRRNWLGTIAGVLSHNSPSFFLSGSADLYDNGWWKLTHDLLPGAYAMLCRSFY